MPNTLHIVGAKMALPQSKWWSIGVTALCAALSVILTAIVNSAADLNLGPYEGAVVALSTLALKYLASVVANPVEPIPSPTPPRAHKPDGSCSRLPGITDPRGRQG